MKLTKKLEVEILKAYHAYWEAYLKGNMRTMSSYLDDNCQVIGSAQGEVFKNKKETVKYYKTNAAQVAGKAEIRNRKINVTEAGSNILVYEESDFYVLIDAGWTLYGQARVSTLFGKKANKWKIIQQHGSLPDSRTGGGEQLNTDKIREENLRLKDAVQRRTIELEEKNRELEIETSLERVRAVAMGMNKPDDILNICKVMFQELQSLGFSNLRNTLINFWDDANSSLLDFDYSDYAGGNKAKLSYSSHPVFEQFLKKIKKSKDAFAKLVVEKKQLESWKQRRRDSGEYEDPRLNDIDVLYYYFYSIEVGSIGISTFSPLTEEQLTLLKRFRNVFDLAYTRYLDIEKAVAQTLEAQIEASLEKVRAQALGLKKPDDLLQIVEVLFPELNKLGFTELRNAMIQIHNDAARSFVEYEFSYQSGSAISTLPYNIHPVTENLLKQIRSGSDAFAEMAIWGKELKNYRKHLVESGQPDDPRLEGIDSLSYYFYSIGVGSIGISTYSPINEEKRILLRRFRNVFDFAYRRYMDVAQAEAQAREAQIELALERVRARTMAMQNSNELPEAANLLFQQVQSLGMPAWSAGYCIWDDDKKAITLSMSSEGVLQPTLRMPLTEDPSLKHFREAHERGESFFVEEVGGKALKSHYEYLRTLPGVKETLDDIEKAGFPVPTFQIFHLVYFSQGFLLFITYEPVPEAHEIFKRFGNVFEQTYTRFLDLQKAEAQAKEAQIELSLERVRARAMAMHKSEELVSASDVLFQEIKTLGIDSFRVGIGIIDPINKAVEIWSRSELSDNTSVNTILGKVPATIHPFWVGYYKAWEQKENSFAYEIIGDEVRKFYEYNSSFLSYPERKGFNPQEVVSAFYFPEGALNVVSPLALTTDQSNIMVRFAKVFGLTYKRFLDLQKAEAQAKEAKIEAALERVRSRTMAMHKTDELLEAAEIVSKELSALGIEIMNVSYAFVDDDEKSASFYSINPVDGKIAPFSFVFPHTESKEMRSILSSWKKQEAFNVIEMDEKTTLKHQTWVGEQIQKQVTQHGNSMTFSVEAFLAVSPKKAVLHTFNFTKGYVFVIGSARLTNSQEEMLLRFTKVFEMTYRRFLDLKQAEAQAKEAQIEAALERVRSGTMAMHNSNDLLSVINVVKEQLQLLGFDLDAVNFRTDINKSGYQMWLAAPGETFLSKIFIPRIDYRGTHLLEEALGKKQDFLTYVLSKEEKDIYFHNFFENTVLKEKSNEFRQSIYDSPGMAVSLVILPSIVLTVTNFKGIPFTNDENVIIKRFGNVFEQSYTRFLDLQKAEAQAREAKIEAALERTRTQSMIMQHSKELDDTLRVFHEQVLSLGIPSAFSYLWLPDEKNEQHIFWAAWKENLPGGQAGGNGSTLFNSKAINYPLDRNEPATAQCLIDWKSIEPVYSYHVPPAAVENYFAVWQELLAGVEHLKPEYFSGGLNYVEAFMKYGCFGVIVTTDLTEDEKKLLSRFAIEFERTYTRFLDLQKAEAQAREAQIELGLERVRARAMAMQKSDELSELVDTVFKELTKLDFALTWCIINIIDESSLTNTVWAANPDINKAPESYYMKFEDYPYHHAMLKDWKERKTKSVYTLEGDEKRIYDDYLFSETEFKRTPEVAQAASRAMEKYVCSFSFSNFGGLQTVGDVPLSDANLDILSRFGKVFDLTYTRFNDLKQAEAQAREAQIEVALERVRAVAMAMRKPEELMQISEVIYKQLVVLGFAGVRNVQIAIDDDEKKTYNGVEYSENYQNRFKQVPYDSSPLFAEIAKEMKRSNTAFYQKEISGQEFEDWRNWRTNIQDREDSNIHPGLASATSMCFYLHSVGTGMLGISTFEPITVEHLDILKRFKNVFELSYRIYIDIEKAEAQAREAKIEAALERVRSRSMGMQKSEELKEVIQIVYEQFVHLNINIGHTGFVMDYKTRDDYNIWIADPHGAPSQVTIPYFDSVYYNRFNEAKEKGIDFFATNLNFEEKNKFYQTLFKHVPGLPEEAKDFYFNCPGLAASTVLLENIGLYIENFSGIPYTDEENNTLMRFGKVFQQTYTRFLDLQKAEAQTREAQIEAALERVRSRSLAMHQSNELEDVIMVVSEQLQQLQFRFHNVSFTRYNDQGDLSFWLATPAQEKPYLIEVPFLDNLIFTKPLEILKKGGDFIADILTTEENQEWIKHLLSHSVLKNISDEDKKFLLDTKGYARSLVLMKNINLVIGNYAAIPYSDEQNAILKRFGKVFEQAYTRFLDLQKAEAQAKEAQIEAALERVRASSMAMHHSENLHEVIMVVTQQFQQLGFAFDTANFMTNYSEKGVNIWVSTPGVPVPSRIYIPRVPIIFFKVLDEQLAMGAGFIAYTLSSDDKNTFFKHFFENTDGKYIADERKQFIYQSPGLSTSVVLLKNVFLTLVNYRAIPYSEEENEIIKRFAKVFEQSYTRFLDLQKAEAQTREAQIEAALERVRSKAMAMHKSEDLHAAVKVVFEELDKLNIGVLRVGISVLNKEKRCGNVWLTSIDEGKAVQVSGDESFDIHPLLHGAFEAWLRKEDFYYLLQGEDLIQYYKAVQAEHIQLPESQLHLVGSDLKQYIFVAAYNSGGLFAFRETDFPEEAKTVMKRFANVFDLTYKRFLDLQKAEEQAREAQIEASLERIRAKAMSMHHSDELDEVLTVLFDQFDLLGIESMSTHMTLIDLESNTFTFRETGKGGHRSYGEQTVAIDSMDIWKHEAEKWRNSEPLSINRLHFPKESLPQVWQIFHESFASMPDNAKIYPEDYPDGIYHTAGNCKFGYIGMNQIKKATEEEEEIVLKFATEFGRFYQRFLDLKKAESQAKEATIEAALERVRYRAMAMQTSNDVGEATSTMFTELDTLGIETFRCGIAIIVGDEMEVWSMGQTGDGRTVKGVGRVATHMHPLWKLFHESAKRKDDFLYYFLAGKEKDDYVKILTTTASYSLTQTNLNFPDLHFQAFHFEEGGIFTFSVNPHSDADKSVMKRFTNVFSLTFRRYLDLKQAEAQARESKIETSLERIRSKALAMHSSGDLSETINVFFKELKILGVTPRRCGVGLVDDETHIATLTTTTSTEQGDSMKLIGNLLLRGHPVLEGIYDNWKMQKEYFPVLKGEELKTYYQVLLKQLTVPLFAEDEVQYGYYFYFKEGGVYAWTQHELVEEDLKLFRRFTSVLSLTYKRFNDLRQAEEQNRESQIQLALERVRARTMAMQKSEELADAAVVLFQQFAALGQTPDRISIGIIDEKNNITDVWATDQQGTQVNVRFKARNDERTTIQTILKEWKAGKRSTIVDLQGDDLKNWITYLRTELGMKIDDKYFHGRRLHQVSFFSQGWLNITTLEPLPAETLVLLDRFAAVFTLTYTRFIDLKKAEAQARESQIEASLERVRAKAMSMQKSDDLANAVAIVFEELDKLDLGMMRCGIGILNQEKRSADVWTTTKSDNNTVVQVFGDESMDIHPLLRGAFDAWISQTDYNYILEGDDLNDYYKALSKGNFRLPESQSLTEKTEGLVHYYFNAIFSSGGLFAFRETPFPEEAKTVMKRFSGVFNLTYTRFNDLKIAEAHAEQAELDLLQLKEEKKRTEEALAELQVTQKQLIQSEKMASLGELTAGIAHEIQNPLNFVNNFSEVSNELLDEMMEEVSKGNFDEVKAIVEDVKQNLEKINHHGKRADGIVKGMLQHSRSSSGQKEPTSINALADEYLRLAYHGLRAKDKTFNASMKTDYDETIGTISIIPQDIGRVILNLITNAFYAVNEKKIQHPDGYEPLVSVITKKEGDKVLVSVKDNGNGIPPRVLDKIFQPFFTTKPTGQGTGLGLSLSYDIIKAHGGELRVETKEGEGTIFIINLPSA